MAPFKLKFRMGSSRSTSQEHEPDPQVNEALLNHQSNATIGASSSTIDSVDCNSLVSLNTSERKLLLPNKGNSMRMGFINQNQTIQGESIPDTPPPTYEHVLEEQRQLSIAGILSNNDPLLHLNELEHLSLNELPCNDPNCQENYNSLSSNGNAATTINNQHHSNTNIVNNNEISITITHANNHHDSLNLNNEHLANEDTEEDNTNTIEDDRKESIDSQELLLGDTMTDAASDQERRREHQTQQQQHQQQLQQQHQQLQQHQQQQQQQQMIDNQSCSGNCQQYGADGSASCSGIGITQGEHNQNNDFYDPLMNHGVYCNDASHYNDDYHNHQQIYEDDGSECPGNTGECLGDSGECTCNAGGDDNACNDAHNQWVDMQQQQQQQQHSSGSHQSLHCDSDDQELQQNPYEQQYQHQLQQQQYFQQQLERSLTPEIISNKSSKEIYKDLAKQCGITCKMSDGCRCMECQSHYFDCEYDDVGGDLNLNEHQKTDGGLGAGTPMFITEVMHGSACNIL